MQPLLWARVLWQSASGRWHNQRLNSKSCRGKQAHIVILEGGEPSPRQHHEVRSFTTGLGGSKLSGLYCDLGPLDPTTFQLKTA